MTNETKKTLIIVVLSLIIIGLIWFIFTGNSGTQVIIDKIRDERNQLVRSAGIIESELDRSIGENTQLQKDNIELRNNNTELEQLIDNLTAGSAKTKNYLTEYGTINNDLADFIQQNKSME